MKWTPEARRILTGSASGEFTLWNGLTFNFETILQAHDSTIRAIRFNHSGTFLASSDDSGVVKYFQPNMNNVAAWPAHRESVRGLTFSPDDARFVTCSDDSKLKLWSFETMREERTFTGSCTLTSIEGLVNMISGRTWLGCQMRGMAPYQRSACFRE